MPEVSIAFPSPRDAGRAIVAALLPQDCFLCGARTGAGALCAPCALALPRLPAARCPVCALPTSDARLCGRCLARPPHFDATRAAYAYAFPVDCLIQALKYRARLALAPFLAQALEGLLPDGASRLMPLPLHPRRLKERGFNQALEIARPLASRGCIRLDTGSVERELDTAPQASLSWDERGRNVRGAFLCHADLAGEHVVVLDDVMTTGATLDEFARALKKRGAARVTNLVVARTLPE
ncbi:MAG: ComF family protein [Rhodocyclaceae bacterium]